MWHSDLQDSGVPDLCVVAPLYVPRIMITTPKIDLCWTCQQNTIAVTSSSNRSEEEKAKVYKQCGDTFNIWFQKLATAQGHIDLAQKERGFYKSKYLESSNQLETLFTTDGTVCLPDPYPLPGVVDVTLHFSCDYAQQVKTVYKAEVSLNTVPVLIRSTIPATLFNQARSAF